MLSYQYIHVPYNESDYEKRIPSEEFEHLKEIEDQILGFVGKENLKTYVVAAGIMYGNGEKVFNEHFKVI